MKSKYNDVDDGGVGVEYVIHLVLSQTEVISKTSYSYFRVKLQQSVRFYSLERFSVLLDICRTEDIGHTT